MNKAPVHYTGDDPLGDALSLLERAWAIIANASSGNWSLESGAWQEAARTWRDSWLYYLGFKTRATGPVPGEAPLGILPRRRRISDILRVLRQEDFYLTRAEFTLIADASADAFARSKR